MLETFNLIDRDYFQSFGWRQASIWALEEPESSLHASLEARVAAYLSGICNEPSSRLQVVCTSHSDLVVQHSGRAILVRRDDGRTVCDCPSSPREALDDLARSGVTRWTHPLLFYPLDPVVFVEGKYDADFVKEALRFLRPTRPVHVTFFGLLDDGRSGGKDEIVRYVKANAKAIKVRRPDAPVIVVFDWDATHEARGLQNHFDAGDPFKVLVWPKSSFNPCLNKSFRGIERSYSDRMIDEAETRGATVYRDASGVCQVERDAYEQMIKPLLSDIVSEGLLRSDFGTLQRTSLRRFSKRRRLGSHFAQGVPRERT